MKKIIVSVLALFTFATTLSAQNKGDMYLGGHLGITTTSITINSIGQNTTQFSLTPEYGYFEPRISELEPLYPTNSQLMAL